MKKLDSPERFYHESFRIDDLSVTRALLNWRDKWYMAGWDGTFLKKAGRRLKDMAEVEVLASKEVSPSAGLRLQAGLKALKSRNTQIEKIELVDEPSDVPYLWQKILAHFEVFEMKADQRPSAASS